MKLKHMAAVLSLAVSGISCAMTTPTGSYTCPTLKEVKSTVASMPEHFFSRATWFKEGQVWTVLTDNNIIMNPKNKPYTMQMLGVPKKQSEKQQAIVFANKNLHNYLTVEPIKSPNPYIQACIYYLNFSGGDNPLEIFASPGSAADHITP